MRGSWDQGKMGDIDTHRNCSYPTMLDWAVQHLLLFTKMPVHFIESNQEIPKLLSRNSLLFIAPQPSESHQGLD
ncbi:hypothetical protein STEG23_025722 [Scotinomys teguina]